MNTTEKTIDFKNLSDAEWHKRLDEAQFNVLRKHGTERAGTSALNHEKRKGTFECAGCDLPLFSSDTKFESGNRLAELLSATAERGRHHDRSQLLHEPHRGALQPLRGPSRHVFDDGPKPTGLRYCMNGVAMKFEPQAAGQS